MKLFRTKKYAILAEAIEEEKRKLAGKKEHVEEMSRELHKIRPIAGEILAGYVETILIKQKAGIRDV